MAEELTADQRVELEEQLKSLKTNLEELLDSSEAYTRPVALDEPIGRLSRMDAIQQKEMACSNRRNYEIRLQQISAALAAVRREEYGECNLCGDDIGYLRLKARPEAPLCVDCRSAVESRQK